MKLSDVPGFLDKTLTLYAALKEGQQPLTEYAKGIRFALSQQGQVEVELDVQEIAKVIYDLLDMKRREKEIEELLNQKPTITATELQAVRGQAMNKCIYLAKALNASLPKLLKVKK